MAFSGGEQRQCFETLRRHTESNFSGEAVLIFNGL